MLGVLLQECLVDGEGSALGVCQMMIAGQLMEVEIDVPDRRLQRQWKGSRCRYY
jgi:hypothetical protein